MAEQHSSNNSEYHSISQLPELEAIRKLDIQDNPSQYLSELLNDIYTMMNYARKSGIDIPEPLGQAIAHLLAPYDTLK